MFTLRTVYDLRLVPTQFYNQVIKVQNFESNLLSPVVRWTVVAGAAVSKDGASTFYQGV